MLINGKTVYYNYNSITSISTGLGVIKCKGTDNASLDAYFIVTAYSLVKLAGNGLESISGVSYKLQEILFTFIANINQVTNSRVYSL